MRTSEVLRGLVMHREPIEHIARVFLAVIIVIALWLGLVVSYQRGWVAGYQVGKEEWRRK